MKKYTLTYLILTAFLILGIPNLGAQTQDAESTPPEDIRALHVKVQKIDDALQKAREVDASQEAIVPSLQEQKEDVEFLTPDQILDSVIKKENQNKTMDLDFDQTNLGNILHMIGSIAEMNIVLDPALKGNVMDLHLKSVKIHEALSIMADSYGLAFKRIGDSLFVTSKERIRGDSLISRIIKLRNVKASDIKSMAHNILESITVSEDTNSIMVLGTEEEIRKVENIVKKIDLPQPQVLLECRIIEINKDAMKNLGIDWSSTLTANFQESKRPSTFSTTQTPAGSALQVYSLARSPLQFEATLNMLEQDNLAKTLSSPRIITMNNQKAEIFVGDRIPYTITTFAGGVATTEVQFVEPGIRLRITPSIIDNDFVVIKVEPEVSYIFSFIGPQNQYPWVKTRNATANVRIENNHPFILGGLLSQGDTKNFQKIPVLGSIPFLGKLFNNQNHSESTSELIILVVPVIINK
jgi:type II secretory pathway component GspD/PulD (secretin)